jgi:uncharacterized membrane protein YozB (DUF420 family)
MDNLYLQPEGFLGTGASLLADLTLLAYILLIIPGMLAGFVFAKRNLHRPHHQMLMISITVINWLLIIFLMVTAYRFDVVSNIGTQPTNLRYLMPTVHGLLGLPAQLLATYVVIRMIIEDVNVARARQRGEKNLSKYWFKGAKPFMRVTLVLWLATALLGIVTYAIRYDLVSIGGTGGDVPGATEEAGVPEATPETTPEATPEPESTPEAEPETTPEMTPESTPEPAETPEVEPDETPETEEESD